LVCRQIVLWIERDHLAIRCVIAPPEDEVGAAGETHRRHQNTRYARGDQSCGEHSGRRFLTIDQEHGLPWREAHGSVDPAGGEHVSLAEIKNARDIHVIGTECPGADAKILLILGDCRGSYSATAVVNSADI
jgi:hypothetical protein